MIKINGNFAVSDTATMMYRGSEFYIFVKIQFNNPGYVDAYGAIYKDQALTQKVGEHFIGQRPIADITGGQGTNEYDKILNRVENYVVNLLGTINPGLQITRL